MSFVRGLQGCRSILASYPHIVWPKPATAKVLFCPMLQGSQPSPACPFHKSSIKLTMSTGGIILAGENRSIRRKPRPSVTGSGLRRVTPATGRLGQGTLNEQPGMHDACTPEQLSSNVFTQIPSVPIVTTTYSCTALCLSVSLATMSSLQTTPTSLLISNSSF